VATERQKTRTKPGETETPESPKDKRADYLTARQLAEVLQISEATVHRLRRSGRIPAVLLTDRLIRFNLRDVQKALRPTTSPHASDDGEPEPSSQLTFEQVDPNFQ